ncbi:OprO/OprP family phosphate-selective porin [Sphingomicrobium astaxanthinifaciens]|uniref:OprO/OprP family phosphate-selective porin n=1 Tax=Sphingomicrobium astaxanthinifaciens TaxID=1227949 RepID=UPI001FCB97E8|nr:porin [Sphingomicrobium astaxanthinifaciens]MCJ7421016.1 OprO/OprP family phosphate-selective porin [Sphingomicrobium astaxanthinifaciens]
MMAKLITTAPLALVLALAASPAQAQELTPEEARAILERLEALEAETAALRARLEATETQAEAAGTSATAAGAAAMAAQDVAMQAKEAASKTPAISRFEKSDGFTLKPRGRLQFDMGGVDTPGPAIRDDLGNAVEVRRARLGVSGDLPGDFDYKFELDFTGNHVAFTDAYVDYDAGPATLTLGQHNGFQGLEEITSSNDISFMERAAFTDAFGFERRVGLSAQGSHGDLHLWGGAFSSNTDDLGAGVQAWALDARAVYAPVVGAAQLHFGGSVHYRNLDEDDPLVRYRQRPLIHVTDVRFIDTGRILAEEEMSYGLEAAAILGRWHAAAEAHWMRPDATVLDDPLFFGGYAEVGYMLTPGYRRGYSPGAFKAVKPVDGGRWSGLGALQLNLRYDRLDLTDEAIVGGTQDAIAAALSWHPNSYLRFLVNYARIDYDDVTPSSRIPTLVENEGAVEVVGARAQFAF